MKVGGDSATYSLYHHTMGNYYLDCERWYMQTLSAQVESGTVKPVDCEIETSMHEVLRRKND